MGSGSNFRSAWAAVGGAPGRRPDGCHAQGDRRPRADGQRHTWVAAGRVPRRGRLRARKGRDAPGRWPRVGGSRSRADVCAQGGGESSAATGQTWAMGREAPPQGRDGRQGGAWRTAANPTSRFACFNRVVKGGKAMGISVFSLGVFFIFFFSTV